MLMFILFFESLENEVWLGMVKYQYGFDNDEVIIVYYCLNDWRFDY